MLAAAIVAGLFFVWPASPAGADGLSRFEQAIKDAPPGVLAYKSGKALGDNGFVLEGVVVDPDPEAKGAGKPEAVQIKRITVEDFDFASAEKKAAPNFVKMRAEGIIVSAKAVDGIDLKEMAGLDTVTADFQLDYRLDPERKTMTLNRLELDLNGLARIELTMVLDGVDPDAVDSAASSATLRTASLVFEDRSLLGTTLPAAAKAQGADIEELVKMAKAMLDGLRAGQETATLAVLDALASYVEDYKQPKGALRVTLNPTAKATVESLGELKNPEDAIKMLGLVVSYPGTRPHKPANPAR
jgi:hypothetical protein